MEYYIYLFTLQNRIGFKGLERSFHKDVPSINFAIFKMSSTDAQIPQIILSDEIWLMVFDYLPLYDRKHIRLTCRRFYEICNCAHLLEFEELVFLGNFNTNAAIESLSTSQRKTWNIKLMLVRLMDDSILIFFQNQGANIRSLEFYHCNITPALLEGILKCCENLRSFALHLRIEDGTLKECDCAKDNIFHVFDALRKNGIIRQYVTDFTFTLIIDCETLVSVFSQIRNSTICL